MAVVTLQSSGYEFDILESGAACFPKGTKSFDITIADLKLSFEFGEVEAEAKPNVVQLDVSPKAVRLRLDNFASPLGAVWQSPVGELNGKPLSIVLSLKTIGATDNPSWSLTYSFLRTVRSI